MHKYHIPSISSTCSIFQLLTNSNRALSASAIAQQLELPKTSVYRILQTLTSEGMLQKVKSSYIMGHKLINLGFKATSNITERQFCVPILQELMVLTKTNSHFAILSDNKSLIIEVCDSPHASRVASRPGTLVDLHCSATGKCFLAFAPPQITNSIIDSIPFSQRTQKTHRSKESLLQELTIIRRQGYAIEDEEYSDGARCLAAPITNQHNQVTGAIGITESTENIPLARIPLVANYLKKAARQLSAQFIHSSN